MSLTKDLVKSLLQQCLPLAVLKLDGSVFVSRNFTSCNSAYRLRYWNIIIGTSIYVNHLGCNSAYRLRYWNNAKSSRPTLRALMLQQYLPLAVLKLSVKRYLKFPPVTNSVATVLTACGIETYHLWYYRREVQTAVATVLTACGIETRAILNVPSFLSCNSAYRLRYWNAGKMIILW